MSEGLGQRYGAPRRRAGERLHTEIGRDEVRAGQLDTLLAQLEFSLSEAQQPQGDDLTSLLGSVESTPVLLSASSVASSTSTTGPAPGVPSSPTKGPQSDGPLGLGLGLGLGPELLSERQQQAGYGRLRDLQGAWGLLGQVRAIFLQRSVYLNVIDPDQLAQLNPSAPAPAPTPAPAGPPATNPNPKDKDKGKDKGKDSKDKDKKEAEVKEVSSNKPLSPVAAPIPWLQSVRLMSLLEPNPNPNPGQDLSVPVAASAGPEVTAATLELFWEDVDRTCRQETVQLYESEGVAGPGEGLPVSLLQWLQESKEKLLHYREKAWKRLWGQVRRSEVLLARKGLTDSDGTDGQDHNELSHSLSAHPNLATSSQATLTLAASLASSSLARKTGNASAICLFLKPMD